MIAWKALTGEIIIMNYEAKLIIGQKPEQLSVTMDMVADEKIAEIISDPEADIDQKGSALLREANQNGGKDNIAVVLVEPFTNEVETC